MADMKVTNMPLKVGHVLTVTGIPTAGAKRFELNIYSGSEIALHINGRFDQDMVVYNTQKAGVWGEEVYGGFPFKHNQLFKFSVNLTGAEFVVVLSDGSEVHFPNRLGATEYQDFSLKEGVHVRSFEII